MIAKEEKTRALNWLYDTGNPVIRLWAAERLAVPSGELARLRAEMLLHPDVRHWIDCLMGIVDRPALHGSFDYCLENSMRKAFQFGFRPEDDAGTGHMNAAMLDRLEYQLQHPTWVNPVDYTIMASCLLGMGREDKAAVSSILERLDSTCELLPGSDFVMHTDPAGYPKIPAGRRRHPLVHPRFYDGNRYRYPLVYDLFAYASLPPSVSSQEEVKNKIGTVMSVILDERYQRLPWGYGLVFVPPNKYYSMGWSVHLPRFFGQEESRISVSSAVWWAEAMASFPAAVRSDWFKRLMEHLDGFRTADGFWKFPANYLTEGPNHYFVGGGHMGLGENRKSRDALKIESTAWMLRILEKCRPEA